MTYPFRAFLAVAAFLAPVLRYYGLSERLPQKSLPGSFFLIFFLQSLVYFIWSVFVYPKLFDPLLRIPAVKDANFFTGNGLEIIRRPTGDPHRQWMEETPNPGLYRYSHLFSSTRICLTSPKAMSEVMVQKSYDFIKPTRIQAALSRVLGDGVLVAEGDEHRRQRKLLMPAFSFRHVKDLYPTFWGISRRLVETMSESIQNQVVNADGEVPIEILNWVSRATLDIIGTAGCGQDFDSLHNPDNELSRAYRDLFQPQHNRFAMFLQLLGQFLPVKLLRIIPSKHNDTIRNSVITIRKASAEIIRRKRESMEKDGRTDFDIISVALESGGFTDNELIDQVMTFLAAGHETTSTATLWAVYHLCNDKKIQLRLREEIRTNLPSISDTSKPITSAELDRLVYLNAFCQEVLRLTPPVPITMRIAKEDSTIQGYATPKNTLILISPWAVNANKELWGEDAHEFNPERWMGPGKANTGGAQSNYSFLTFLHGPRSCIGQAFAKAEFACLVAALVGRFEMDFPKAGYELKRGGEITLRPQEMKVKLQPIEGW